METSMTVKAKVGDVVRIPTPKGFGYALYTHKTPGYGALLRVFPGVQSSETPDLRVILTRKPQFSTFFPLNEAVECGAVEIVANVPVPPDLKPFPVFKAAMRDPTTGVVSAWWRWDGKKEWRVGELTPEQRVLPVREVINDTLLIERIIGGWDSTRAS